MLPLKYASFAEQDISWSLIKMIYRLRKKFISICILSFITVFSVVLSLIFLITSLQTNRTLDRHADMISQNDGRFPNFNEIVTGTDRPIPPDGFNRESPFTTRYFTVMFDNESGAVHTDTRQIASVTEEEAKGYANTALNAGRERGWADDYRYKIYSTESGTSIVFVSGISARENNRGFMLGTLTVFAMCSFVIIILIVIISQRAVKPAAESYEKQKQFITNASHELKTPITLIRTNLDILESEIGESEWISDIRDESVLMSELVNQMVVLARMDEEETKVEFKEFSISDAVADTVSSFTSAVEGDGKHLTVNINSPLLYTGDEAGIRQIVSILMDNALKYCDSGGEITVSLIGDKHPVLTVENSYAAVGNIELQRLFDRFYRADKARTWGTGFGIGLSMAKAITEKHHGSIIVYNIENNKIGFKVKL